MSTRPPTGLGVSRRAVAGGVALVLVLALWGAAALLPLPYVTYSPGLTVDVLGTTGDGGQAGKGEQSEIVQVDGRRTYRDDGQLRLTTVYVTRPEGRVDLFEALAAWWDPEQAIYPRDAVYAPDQSAEDARRESAVQMVASQDTAAAAALREVGLDPQRVVEVLRVSEDMPAQGEFRVGDVLLRAAGERIGDAQDVVDAVEGVEAGDPVDFVIRRDGKRRKVTVAPTETDDGPKVGIVPGPGYDFPIDVNVDIPENIGGPSAGLVFALAIYDTLTPGSLTGGAAVAGTGTVGPDGRIGPIGGIQQKVVAARDDGAGLFLVPPRNCAEAREAPTGDMRLARAETVHDAVSILETWSQDRDAKLPSCAAADAGGTR